MQTKTETYRYECFGETLEYAEGLGFDSAAVESEMMENDGGGYTPSQQRMRLEDAAIEFIEGKGIKVIMEEENEN